MADEPTEVIEPQLKLESPNMDEQSAAPKEVVAEVIPDKEKVGGDEVKPAEAKSVETTEVEETPVIEAVDWKDKELKRKHAQIKERDRQLAEQAQKIADLEALANRAPKEGEEPVRLERPAAMNQDQINAAAVRLRESERYQEDLTKINEAGEKAYKGDWAKSLENLATLGTVEMPVMQGILATDDPAKVLYELGKNPAEYQRIMELRPERRQTEFVKLSLKAAPKAKPSAAPEPVETVRGRVLPSVLPQDSDDDDTWYAKWAAHQETKRKKSA